jgi:hypothetical protein
MGPQKGDEAFIYDDIGGKKSLNIFSTIISQKIPIYVVAS